MSLHARRLDSFACLSFQPELRPVITRAVEPLLSYTEQVFLRGQEAYDAVSGRERPIRFETIQTFRYSESGEMIFPVGYWPEVAQVLQANNVTPPVLPLPPQRASRPNALEPDLAGLMSRLAPAGEDPFRYRQAEALAAAMAAISTGVGGVINAPTGVGKGFLIKALVMAYPKARIDVIAPSLPTVRNLEKRLNVVVSDLGTVHGGSKSLGRRVTLYCADSLKHAPHEGDDEADIVLFDEVHEAAAPTIAHQLSQYRNAAKIGLTASYNMRFDGRDHVLKGLFGPERFYMSYADGAANGVVLPMEANWLHPTVDDSLTRQLKNMSGIDRERYGIWQNSGRNLMFAEYGNICREEGKQVLILVKTVEHAFHLKRFLPDWPLVYDKVDRADYLRYMAAGLVTETGEPPMSKPRRAKLTEAFEAGELRFAIATMVWSVGVDFLELSELLRADGMGSDIASVQLPGRASRIHPVSGKSVGRVTDSCDRFNDSIFRNTTKRRKQYQKMGWAETGWK